MEKESAIGKINKVGKIGTVIITILKVLLIIGMVVTVVGSVLLYIIPDDIFTADMTMNVDMKIDMASFVSKDDKIETWEEQNIEETLKKIKSLGLKAGIAINPPTPVSEIIPYIGMADMVLVMTVNPGFGGQKYISECTDKIREIRRVIDEKYPDVLLQIDGGVNLNNLQMNLDAGANVIVAGSAVFKGNIKENTLKFLNILG